MIDGAGDSVIGQIMPFYTGWRQATAAAVDTAATLAVAPAAAGFHSQKCRETSRRIQKIVATSSAAFILQHLHRTDFTTAGKSFHNN